MPTLHFTQNLARHTPCPSSNIDATSVGELLEKYFEQWPVVLSFVLDDQGEVRKHVKVLVDGRNLHDRRRLTDTLDEDSEVHVFQALSGG